MQDQYRGADLHLCIETQNKANVTQDNVMISEP